MKLRTINEAARELGIPVHRLRRGIQAGKYPSLRWGNRVLVDLDALKPILEEERRQSADADAVDLNTCADAIGVTSDVLWRMAQAGLVPYTRVGRAYRFQVAAVEAAIREKMT